MPLYESVFIVRQDVTAAQVDALGDGFAKIVEENGGAMDRREYWGLRTLSYRIKKNRKGHYVLFNMNAPSACVQEMERNMRLNEDVLRYMTIRLDEERPDPSPIMQGKGDRERERADRGGRGGPRGRSDRPERSDRPGTAPAAKTETPAAKTEEPAAKAEEPAAKAEEPAAKAEKPAAKTETPAAKTEEPAAKAEEPAAKTEKPAAKTEKPAAKAEEPAAKAENAAEKPAETASAPAETKETES
jgi:small subunit ribosomal protein S6